MKSPSLDFFKMLQILNEHEVDYIVVGGVCAVCHGAPITTFDLDIVPSYSDENIDRMVSALDDLDSHSRLHQKRIKPGKSHLQSKGHLLLQTRYGPLDVLGTIGSGRDFDNLLNDTLTGTIRDLSFRLLDLPTLILTKEEAGRDKDKLALPILRSALNQKT